MIRPDDVRFDPATGLVPVVAQHHRTGEVLMLGYADREALARTAATGRLTFWSRSRQAPWTKGETSGNVLEVLALHTDCDNDAILALVDPAGPTCHTGAWSCFDAPPTLPALARTLEDRARRRPDGSYTVRLLDDPNRRRKKLGEEAVELAVACAGGNTEAIRAEAADLLYHLLVACMADGVSLDDVLRALSERAD
jgi:phosphoribosyl-AMP cyclohydrolase / phosphoribosyl-ATP pyrophosphohydrolase